MIKNLLDAADTGDDDRSLSPAKKDQSDASSLPARHDDNDAVKGRPASSAGETIRRTGLAWSAGVVFAGSVIFMLVLGWLADLLLGSAPWGIVLGIVIGSTIGFVQFFRVTSQIFKK